MDLSTSDSAVGIPLADTLRDDVQHRTNGAIRNLNVAIEDGAVILTGATTRYYNKQLATCAVLDIVGELDLRNLIEVQTNRTK